MPVDAGGGPPPPNHVPQHSEKLAINRSHLDALYSQLDTLSRKVDALESSLGHDVRTILTLLQERPTASNAPPCPSAPGPGWFVGEVAMIKESEVQFNLWYCSTGDFGFKCRFQMNV